MKWKEFDETVEQLNLWDTTYTKHKKCLRKVLNGGIKMAKYKDQTFKTFSKISKEVNKYLIVPVTRYMLLGLFSVKSTTPVLTTLIYSLLQLKIGRLPL